MNLVSIFKTVILLSSMGSILALLIIFIKYMFKYKLGAHWHFYIWFLLIIRLAVPYKLQSSLSIFNLFNAYNTKSYVTYESTQENINSNTAANRQMEGDAKLPAALKDNTHPDISGNITHNLTAYLPLASKTYLIIAAMLALYYISVNILSSAKIRKQPHCKDAEIIKIFEECKAYMKVYSNIPLCYDLYCKSPSLFGFIRPKILISHETLEKLSETELKYIFLHELVHFKRKDILLNWIIIFLQIVNWFNPVLWYSFYLLKEDCEVSCDAYVLFYLNLDEREEYGRTILKLSGLVSNTPCKPGFANIINHESNIRRRIVMLTKFKNKSRISIIAICVFLIVGAVGLTNSTGLAKTINADDLTISGSENINTIQLAKQFLPQNSSLIDPQSGKTSDYALQKDLDGDGKAEIIGFYKLNDQNINNQRTSVLVLKELQGKWTKALDITNLGYAVTKVSEIDLDGDGKNELVLGFQCGAIWSQLHIYQWKNNSLIKFTDEELYYSKLDIINNSKKAALVLWDHDTGTAYRIDILEWNGTKFVSAKYNYPDYFKSNVVPYYENMAKLVPNSAIPWYYLADADVAAGKNDEAKKSIAKGLSLNAEYPSREDFMKLLLLADK